MVAAVIGEGRQDVAPAVEGRRELRRAAEAREATDRVRHSLENRQGMLRWTTAAAAVLGTAAGAYGAHALVVDDPQRASWLLVPTGVLALFCILRLGQLVLVRQELRETELRAVTDEQAEMLERAGGEDLGQFMAFSHRQMSRFECVAVEQATVSHLASVLSAAAGFGVLAAGAAITLSSGSTASTAAGATMTAVGTALAGFLSRTFIRTYRTTVDQMSHYYLQPVVNCYLLHAELLTKRAAAFGPGFAQDEAKVILDRLLDIAGHAQDHLLGDGAPPTGRRGRRAG